ALVTRRVARLERLGSGAVPDLLNRLASQRDRQVVALPRLLERGERLQHLAELIAHDPEIERGLALAEVDSERAFEILLCVLKTLEAPLDHTRQHHDAGVRHVHPRSIGVGARLLEVLESKIVPPA